MGKVKEQTKYEVLNDLLGAYGRAAITAGQFWGHMKERGWGQDDIDEFCVEHHKREKEKDDEREKDRAQGSATASAARSTGGQEHGRHQESAWAQGQEQGQEDNGSVPKEERSRQVRRPLDINSEKGQKTLENEQEAAKIFSEHNPNRLYA